LLADIPVKVIGGVEYYEFRVDLNENNSSAGKLVSLNAFKFYTSASPEGEMAQLFNDHASRIFVSRSRRVRAVPFSLCRIWPGRPNFPRTS
jgi:hypothetical protein